MYQENVTSTPETWSPESAFIRSLTNLPEDNFQKIVNMDYSGFTDISDVYQEWGRRGYLRFSPYVRDPEGETHPVLTIRHDRHLSLFRGARFQVSETADGINSCETSSYRLTPFLYHRNDDVWSNSLLLSMIYYAAVIDGAYVYDNFRELFLKDVECVDLFVKKSYECFNCNVAFKWADISKRISTTKSWTSMNRNVYKVLSEKGILCEFAFGVKTVQVKTNMYGKGDAILTVEIPDAIEGVDVSGYDEADIDWFRWELAEDCNWVSVKMILVMALALAGVRMNWVSTYAIQKLGTVKGTNWADIVEVKTLNDIDKYEPDNF